jgi:DNA primase
MNIDIKKLLDALQIQYKNSYSKNVLVRCWNPAHNDSTPSLSINLESGVFYCFGCHMKGNAVSIVKHFLQLDTANALAYLRGFSTYSPTITSDDLKLQLVQRIESKRKHVKESKPSRIITLPSNKLAINNKYLIETRGLTNQEIGYYDIRVCTQPGAYNGYILIPIYFKKILVGYFLRDTIGKNKIFSSSHKYLFGYDDICYEKPIVVVEGIFDCIKVRRTYFNCVSMLGNRLTPLHISLLKNFPYVIIFSDNDEGGKWMWLDAMALLPSVTVYVAQLPEGVKDPDSSDSATIKQSLESIRSLHEVVSTPQFYAWKQYVLSKSKRKKI